MLTRLRAGSGVAELSLHGNNPEQINSDQVRLKLQSHLGLELVRVQAALCLLDGGTAASAALLLHCQLEGCMACLHHTALSHAAAQLGTQACKAKIVAAPTKDSIVSLISSTPVVVHVVHVVSTISRRSFSMTT